MDGLFQNTSVWVAVSFAIFVVLFVKKGLPALFAMLDARINVIRKEIATAQKLRDQAQVLLDEYKAKQRESEASSAKMIADARQQADIMKREAQQELKDVMDRREIMLAERLKRMEEAAIDEIRAYAAELAVKATAEIITKRLDAQSAQRLVDESIRKVGGSLN